MNDSKKLLTAMLGDRGYEVLEKAIFKKRTQAVIDPLEFYLPLIVVPRTIISWLIQTIKPMKPGEIKDINFPGRDDISIHFEKQDVDQYRAEFTQGGRVVHSFEKQSLPAASAHLMTVGELYDDFGEKKPESAAVPAPVELTEDTPKAEVPSFDIARQIMALSNVAPVKDPDSLKWEMSHASVRELTSVIGKLIDSLTAKHLATERLESELDKVAEKEVKDQQGKQMESQTPEEKAKADAKAAKADPAIETPQMSYLELERIKAKPSVEQKGPEPKVVKDGEEAQEGKIKKDALHEASMKASKNISSPRMAGAQQDQDQQKPILDRMSHDKGYFRKKHEILSKPYVSDAQRRWAHTDAGTKALGGESKVHEWDESSKGRDLPEHVKKDEKLAAKVKQNAKYPPMHVQRGVRVAGHPDPGRSLSSYDLERGKATANPAHKQIHQSNARFLSRDNLKNLKAMPKPSLPKSEDKSIASSSVPTGQGGMSNVKHPKGNAMSIPVIKEEMGKGGTSSAASGISANAAQDRNGTRRSGVMGGVGLSVGIGFGKEEIPVDKAEMPKGAGQPRQPQGPQAPKPPVPASNMPAASATKQAQSAGKGGYQPPKTPGAPMPKNPAMKPKYPGVNMSKGGDYFRSKLNKPAMSKSEKQFLATEEQLYKSKCNECGTAEFVKGSDGNPHFNPCACFRVLKKDEEGRPYKFVHAIRKSDGSFGLSFAADADPDVVKMFLLTLKARLLIKKNHGI